MRNSGRIPAHVGVIMDGNGRWAQMRGLPRIEGHRRGAERAKEVAEAAIDLGVQCLTLYAFSSENWKRPSSEVSTLMKILEYYLKNELRNLIEKGIVFRTIGDISRLPDNIQELIRQTVARTAKNTGMMLVPALSYSGSSEIIRAIGKIMDAGVSKEELSEETFESFLDTAGIPPPDLIIRTSGERRLSNFLLWQSAYAELYFTDTLWPDFGREEFIMAVQDYQRRERRFGSLPTESNAR